MKNLRLTTLTTLLVMFVTTNSFGQATGPWKGSTITITKSDGSDFTKAANQDRITDSVWITRQNTQGIYNIKVESGYATNSSPSGTRWAFGTTSNIASLTFRTWESAIGSNPPSMVNKDMVLLIIKDSIYIDLKFTKWTAGGGGGFTYVRTTDCRSWDTLKVSMCDSMVSPSKKYVWKKSGVYYTHW